MKPSPWRRLLLPFVPLYGAVLGLKRSLIRRGLLRAKRLPHGVISIGSLSAGGAGKTPVVLMLSRLLQQKAIELRILTRGYRRNSVEIERVDPAGDAARFGDEPLLLAQRLHPASVYAGIDRYRAGMMAERDNPGHGKAIYLLDDGFQHQKLARDVDIVLLTRQEITDRLLPAGNLREPLSELSRADVIVLREEEPDVAAWIAAKMPGLQARVWIVRRRLQLPPEITLPLHPILFCGIARPESFASMLTAEGISPAAAVAFRDHHCYTKKDVEILLKTLTRNRADGFVTTEKDAVKLSAAMVARLETVGPVIVPALEVELIDAEAKIDELLALLAARRGGYA